MKHTECSEHTDRGVFNKQATTISDQQHQARVKVTRREQTDGDDEHN